ncbi:hypothetical protein [Euzebya sp.]|uniref:hypothetical protein n=1 Tax=Euzebya sp. TaxID=1971409 RepID=UPI0035128690
MGRLLTALVLIALLGACTSDPVAPPPSEPAEASPSPGGATRVATAPPTPSPPPTPLPAEPFATVLGDVTVVNTDNDAIYGRPVAPYDPDVAHAVVQEAVGRLDRFLNAQFADPATRLSAAGIGALIDPALLDEPTRAALGELGRDDVVTTRTGTSSATARLLVVGTAVDAVELGYTATFDLVLDDVEGPVEHTGVVVFTPLQGTLTVGGVQPTTTFGGDLGTVLGP